MSEQTKPQDPNGVSVEVDAVLAALQAEVSALTTRAIMAEVARDAAIQERNALREQMPAPATPEPQSEPPR